MSQTDYTKVPAGTPINPDSHEHAETLQARLKQSMTDLGWDVPEINKRTVAEAAGFTETRMVAICPGDRSVGIFPMEFVIQEVYVESPEHREEIRTAFDKFLNLISWGDGEHKVYFQDELDKMEPPHPVEILRGYAEQTGLPVDHQAFDKAKEFMNSCCEHDDIMMIDTDGGEHY